MMINTDNMYYKDLNDRIHEALADGQTSLTLDNVRGQRYIGNGLGEGVNITINGVPGNDLAAFMNGAVIEVNGNAQDAVGNTMNSGKVIIHGIAGDIAGYGMRGGKVFIKGDVGYRAVIHMKAYHDHFPVMVIGGRAQDYLGEYMAGGVVLVLNLSGDENPVGHYIGTGMHGGVIYIRGRVEDYQVGAEVGFAELTDENWRQVGELYTEFCQDMNLEQNKLERGEFVKLYPKSARPYGNLYAY